MIDFHTHILPDMDDGAEGPEMSFAMLKACRESGVDLLVSTSHFYPEDESPQDFIRRRTAAAKKLSSLRSQYGEVSDFPQIVLGAEVLYFRGMSTCSDLQCLTFGRRCILIEPPMDRWTDEMLDEIAETGRFLHAIPIVAHVDRYMRAFDDFTLVDRVCERRMLVQVNASFFLHRECDQYSTRLLTQRKLHLIGSDCHNLSTRAPNLAAASGRAKEMGLATEFKRLSENGRSLLD